VNSSLLTPDTCGTDANQPAAKHSQGHITGGVVEGPCPEPCPPSSDHQQNIAADKLDQSNTYVPSHTIQLLPVDQSQYPVSEDDLKHWLSKYRCLTSNKLAELLEAFLVFAVEPPVSSVPVVTPTGVCSWGPLRPRLNPARFGFCLRAVGLYPTEAEVSRMLSMCPKPPSEVVHGASPAAVAASGADKIASPVAAAESGGGKSAKKTGAGKNVDKDSSPLAAKV